MAEKITIKRGFSALYLIEVAMRAIEGIRASSDSVAEIETIEQLDLADTVVNVGPEISY